MNYLTNMSICIRESWKYVVVLGSIVVAMIVPSTSWAASIQFDTAQHVVGTSSPFKVDVIMDTEVPINTMRIVIDVPEYMDVLEASDGNSIVNIWIERPHITDARQLVFEGIVPGGYKGVRGKLVSLVVRAHKQGRGSFIINASSRLYANDTTATLQPILSRPLDMVVAAGRDMVTMIVPDRTPPEPFTPILVNMPDGGEGSWAISFQTQDKGSGIKSYSVVESTSSYHIDDTDKLLRLPWREVSSPYIVADQQLQSHFYIKATDMHGNSRFAHLGPRHDLSWYRTTGGYILIALLIFLALYVISRRLHVVPR